MEDNYQPETSPDFYEKPLSEESRRDRVTFERRQEEIEKKLDAETDPIKKLRLRKTYDRLEQQLSWQGADPRLFSKKELQSVCNQPLYEDAVEDKYRSKVKSPATAIRAYCIGCMCGSVAAVRDCTELTCPLWNFRMGKDPLRGFALPEYITPLCDDVPEDDEDSDLFSDGEDESDEDAKE